MPSNFAARKSFRSFIPRSALASLALLATLAFCAAAASLDKRRVRLYVFLEQGQRDGALRRDDVRASTREGQSHETYSGAQFQHAEAAPVGRRRERIVVVTAA